MYTRCEVAFAVQISQFYMNLRKVVTVASIIAPVAGVTLRGSVGSRSVGYELRVGLSTSSPTLVHSRATLLWFTWARIWDWARQFYNVSTTDKLRNHAYWFNHCTCTVSSLLTKSFVPYHLKRQSEQNQRVEGVSSRGCPSTSLNTAWFLHATVP
jgi:hypothetical protein